MLSASLLYIQTFRSHHNERVAEVESVLSRVESCEQERDQLYTKMREDAQRRLQERKPNGHLQELEETKAHVRGLGAALEFVQGEQLNLVERVVSVEDQSKKLEAMRRTSRNMDQKMVIRRDGMLLNLFPKKRSDIIADPLICITLVGSDTDAGRKVNGDGPAITAVCFRYLEWNSWLCGRCYRSEAVAFVGVDPISKVNCAS